MEKPVTLPSIDLNIFCDSNWYSSVCNANFDTNEIDYAWNMKEKAVHINCKELLAMYYSLGSFKTYFQNKYVKIFWDSQVGVQIINKMETNESSVCNDTVKNIWLFCVKNKILTTAARIPRAENVTADYKSIKNTKIQSWC